MQVTRFSFTVYKAQRYFYKMQNGSYLETRSCGGGRQDRIHFQKKQNAGRGGLWRSDYKHSDHNYGRLSNRHYQDENLCIVNSVVGGVSAGRSTRRTHAICILETRYPCKIKADVAESKKSASREHQDHTGKQAGFIHGDKPSTVHTRPIAKKRRRAKTIRPNDRRAAHDPIGCRVLRALGDDLIVEWLTPEEVHYTEIALGCEFDWGRAWHGGKVKDKAVAAHIQYDLQRGWKADFVLETYNRDLAFSAFWHLIDLKQLIQLAHQYCHLKTIRKLSYFS